MLCSSRLSISFSRAHLCRIAVCKSASRSLTCSRELPAVAGIAEDEILKRFVSRCFAIETSDYKSFALIRIVADRKV